MIRVHNLACDTLVQGRPFPHIRYVMRLPIARGLFDFPRLVFPDGWAVNYRQDVDPEAVSDKPPFGHRFVGQWPGIQCVPITNNDGSDNTFGRNRSVAVDTIAMRQADRTIENNMQSLRTISIAENCRRESPGFDTGREYREWIASHGDVDGDHSVRKHIVHRSVKIEDRDETFDDVHEDTTSIPVPPEETVSLPEVNVIYE